MFEKLKQKLKRVAERIRKKAEPELVPTLEVPPVSEPEVLPEAPPELPPKVPPEAPPKAPPSKKVPKVPPAKPKAPPEIPSPEKPRRVLRRVVKRITRRELSPKDVEDIIWELQVGLLESDVAVPVTDSIIERVKSGLVGRKLGLKEDPKKLADEVLRQAIQEVLVTERKVDLLGTIDAKRAKGEPAVIVFVGINGHGKTTSIAKLARYLMGRGYKVVLAAADTFRAAGIEQLEIHAERLNVGVVKQRRGADAAAVAYDAISHAKAKGLDVVLVDTAGRMQTDVNLMDEMKKIVRVAKPDLVIFVGDALTGNDAVEQARTFDQTVGITGSILCKMDADARGGAALSITQVTGKPILFLGTGQGYDDLVEFKPEIILNALFGD
ncbi:MAG: signal recognition particle-docking protein FtsY [Candidatus Hodarchaeaceae archaeon]|nr:signal recognition particle-docking protein FtsY [Candidatus Hodarchaeaceae archaeon]